MASYGSKPATQSLSNKPFVRTYTRIKKYGGTTRVPLILLTVEKIESENFNFVLFFLLSSSSFPLCITQKIHGVCKCSAQQTTTLLPEIFLFLVRAACVVYRRVMAQNTSQTPFFTHFVRTYVHNSKTKDHIRMLYLTNDCSTIGDIYFLG